MCGICAVLTTQPVTSEDELVATVGTMSRAQSHRGPDRSAAWADATAGIALGHERLSILDLSSTGDQPMHSASGRLVIAFNGEIYNHEELRRSLAGRGHRFRGTSDTEVLLTGFEEWGIRQTLERSVGMFALALWDRSARELTLARDRAGEKPLFYGWQAGAFLCGSELKSLRAHPAFHADVDRNALALYLRFNYIPAPHSIFSGIYKLAPGTFVSVRPDAPGVIPPPQPYWTLKQSIGDRDHAGQLDDTAAVEELDRLLRQSVRGQMIADVPVGAFLSGGIDSSLVVAVMQAQSAQRVRTFTIGYSDPAYDEAPFAAAVARHLETEHTELYVTPGDAMSVIPSLPRMYDEPFADSSQIPTHLVSRLARGDVTVALTGDGADELFGGYDRYYLGPRMWRTMSRIPRSVRGMLAAGARSLRPTTLDWIDGATARFRSRSAGMSRSRERITKLADVMHANDAQAVCMALATIWPRPEAVVIGGHEPATLLSAWPENGGLRGLEERMMYLDFLTYLPDDILVKVDRASMGVSLETRAPFLDHRIISFAWHLSLNMKIRHGVRKHILRRLLARYVPSQLVERPKKGFAVPIGRWLRGPLRDWAEDFLDEGRLRRAGYFDPAPIRSLWQHHLAERVDGSFALWGILMFEAWRESVTLNV